jgi:hypothetical protein
MRLQLQALPDEIDRVTGRVIQGDTKAIQFENGIYSTNRPEIQEMIEDSYAFRNGEIERADVLEKRARDKALESLMADAEADPELMTELRSRLAKKAAAKKKSEEQTEATA